MAPPSSTTSPSSCCSPARWRGPSGASPSDGMGKWAAVWGSLGYLMSGTLATVQLSFTVIVLGTALGLVGGLLRVMPHARLQRIVGAVVEGVRAVPLLLQMFFIFFGLPALGVEIP